MKNKFTIEQVREFWNETAPIYEDCNKKVEDTHHQRFKEAVKHLKLESGQKVLNIWARTGLAIPYLRRECPEIEIFNLEVSPEFIKIAQKKFPNEKFQQTDLDYLPFEDNYFDQILSLETLEHTPNPSLFLKELFRTLKPGKTLVMSCPPAITDIPFKIYGIIFNDHGEGPHKFPSSRRVKKLLKETGFRLILHKGTLLINLGPQWLKDFGERIINKFQKTPISELGFRQFYVAKKENNSNI